MREEKAHDWECANRDDLRNQRVSPFISITEVADWMKRLGFALLIGYCSTLLTSRILMGQKQTAFKQRAPSQFRELPQNLRSELERRGCMIPLDLPLSSNVVRGQFERPGEFDWAVLCSRRRVTRLLVFWKGSGSNVTELVKIPDEYASNWYIRKVGRAFIMRHYQAYGGPEPPPIDHEAIESGNDHASTVFYRYRGKWLHLQGAD